MTFHILAAVALLFASLPASAQFESFTLGPLLQNYGPKAELEGMEPLPADTRFKVAYDATNGATVGDVNRSFVTAARFLNMHAAAGVDPAHMALAVVLHGDALIDATDGSFYASKRGTDAENINKDLIAVLQRHGVVFYACGQSAAVHGAKKSDLLPGVKLSVSAMTAHALLQQQGYTLNPF